MTESRREILLGYLCGALDEDENRKVQRELKRSESLQLEFAALRKEMRPLVEYAQWTQLAYEPPQGLARRTCRQIWDREEGRHQAVDGSLEADGSLRHNSPRIDRKNSKKKWKPSDIMSLVCVGVLALLFLVPASLFVKNRIVQMVRQKTVNRIVNNTAALSQIHEESLLLGRGENLIIASIDGTDLGTLLASFGETDLSQKTLNYSLPAKREGVKYSFIPQSSVPGLVSYFPVDSLLQPSPQYLQSLPLPQISGLFDPQPVVSSPFSESTPGLTFTEWDGISTPIFAEAGKRNPGGPLFNINREQNLIYRDGRIFFRKSGQ